MVKILQAKYLDSPNREYSYYYKPCQRVGAVSNIMLACQLVITNHLSWRIGNACLALFWDESWEGFEVLNSDDSL